MAFLLGRICTLGITPFFRQQCCKASGQLCCGRRKARTSHRPPLCMPTRAVCRLGLLFCDGSASLGFFSGLFWMIFQANQFVGNLITSLVLQNDPAGEHLLFWLFVA